MSPVTPLIIVPGREAFVSVILKQVCKLFCQSHRLDSEEGECRHSPFPGNSPQGNFPTGGDAIVIVEGMRERLKGGGGQGIRMGLCRSPGDVFTTFTYLCPSVSVCLANEFGNT